MLGLARIELSLGRCTCIKYPSIYLEEKEEVKGD